MNYDPYAPNPDEQLSPEELAAKKEADRKRKFARDWPIEMRKILGGEALKTEYGPYYVRCGRDLGRGYRCFGRMGHSAECSPLFANACDQPLPNSKRCVLTVGHKGKCMPVFPR